MDNNALLRYSRQIILPEVDIDGQQRLIDARVLIIGMGGLGSACSIYMAAAGVGNLVLVDFDNVDISNLQRQIVHITANIGRSKVQSAYEHLLSLNPSIHLTTIDHKMNDVEMEQQMNLATVVVDCCDNFITRFAINRVSVKTRTPLVSAAAIRFEGQLSVFDPRNEDSPCYRCLYDDDIEQQNSCIENGVISPLLGVIGSIQACETMKLIMQTGCTLRGKLLLIDLLNMEFHQANISRDPACPVCQ